MNQPPVERPIPVARSADLEPFNGCKEMIPIREPFDARTPHGPSRVILTARSGNDAVWMSSIKIPTLNDRT